MERLFLESNRTATLQSVRDLRHILEKVTQIAGVDHTRQSSMLLCFSEAATNSVVHSSPKSKQIAIRFGQNSGAWCLEVLDDGGSYNPKKENTTSLLDAQLSLSGSGRGVALIKSACDTLHFHTNVDTGFNCLRMTWQRPDSSIKPTVAIVEDDRALRQLYQAYLSERYTVFTYESGLAALNGIKAKNVDIVLSDIDMPEMDGFSLREHLLADQNSELTPFIFLTATEDEELIDRATSMGIDDYLVKPVTKNLVDKTIQRIIGRSRQIRERLTDRIDQRISAALCPQLPEKVPGWKIAISSRNTGTGGGDMVLHQRTEDSTQLVLADIMGHDETAKFFSHAWGGYLRGLMHVDNETQAPEKLLNILSKCAYQDDLLSMTTLTCIAASLKPCGEFAVACAGHPPPMLISKQFIEPLSVGGVLPGLLPDVQYKNLNTKLLPGQRIAMFTDGIFESADDEAGRVELTNRIFKMLETTIEEPIDRAVRITMESFDRITSGKVRDDTTLVLIEPDI